MIRSAVLVIVALYTIFRLVGHITDPRLTGDEIHRVTGEPARHQRPLANRDRLKFVTWNIARGVRFQQVVEALHSLNADVIALQEVDRFCRRSGGRDVARDLADSLGMNWVSAGEFQEIGEARGGVPALTGQALLSRDPIEGPAAIVFTDQEWFRWRFSPTQPRRGGRIALRARTAGLLVYNVHLESVGNDALRRGQLDEVLADETHQRGKHVVIAGDFNNSAPGRRSAMFPALAAARFANAIRGGAERPTSSKHRHQIDWIFVKGTDQSEGHVERVDDVSDHHPVVTTLTFPEVRDPTR